MKKLVCVVILGFTSYIWGDNTLGVEQLKKGIEQASDAQDYLDSYNWKHLLEKKPYSNAITITEIKFNGHPCGVVVKPGEKIEGKLRFELDRKECRDMRYHRIILGFKDLGAQTSIGAGLGFFAHKDGKEKFELTAPKEPGLYQVRFRHVQAFSEDDALAKWVDSKKRQPYSRTTLGFVLVR